MNDKVVFTVQVRRSGSDKWREIDDQKTNLFEARQVYEHRKSVSGKLKFEHFTRLVRRTIIIHDEVVETNE